MLMLLARHATRRGAILLAVIALAGCGGSTTVTATTTATTTVTTTATPTGTTPTETTPTETGPTSEQGKSPTDPIPFGSTGSIEGWRVKVVSVVTEPAGKVQVNASEAAGHAFVVYTLEVTRTAAEAESPIQLIPRLLGPSKQERGLSTSPLCYGGEPYNDRVHQGGTVRTGGCISVPASDEGQLVMSVGFIHEIWFATK